MRIVKQVLPYLILSALTIVSWRLSTLTDRYAWDPKGTEPLILDISLRAIFIYKVVFWLIVCNGAMFSFISYIKGRKTISLISGGAILLIYFFGGRLVSKELASSYFSVFRNQSVPEELIERPILESGYDIGPRLTEYIQDKSVKNRRYAISGLGKIGYEPATPILSKILFDVNEPDYMRADALMALRSIGTSEAERILIEFESRGDSTVLDLAGQDQ